jgi:hypothetical protein
MYREVEVCPSPFVGLRWMECYSYYGKVVAKVKRSMAFEWQEQNPEWIKALNETYFIIEDTVEKAPYILSEEQFKKKFSYDGNKGSWVWFDFSAKEISA